MLEREQRRQRQGQRGDIADDGSLITPGIGSTQDGIYPKDDSRIPERILAEQRQQQNVHSREQRTEQSQRTPPGQVVFEISLQE